VGELKPKRNPFGAQSCGKALEIPFWCCECESGLAQKIEVAVDGGDAWHHVHGRAVGEWGGVGLKRNHLVQRTR
jgi:hypothetical protein